MEILEMKTSLGFTRTDLHLVKKHYRYLDFGLLSKKSTHDAIY